MDKIKRILINPNSDWFKGKTYQAGTNLIIYSMNFYNEERNLILLYCQDTCEFVTFCASIQK